MAEVPGAQYEPYFTAQPTERPIQLRGVDVSEGAFGGYAANALHTFGMGLKEGADDVFNRAMALRRLQIDGKIRDMTTDYYNEVVPEETKFLTKLGNDAGPEAQTAYLANVERIRQKYVEQAKDYGVYGADKFGNEAASMQRSFVKAAVQHSAQQTKQALKNSYIAHNDALADQAGSASPEELQPLIDKAADNQSKIDDMNGVDKADTFERQWNRRIAVSKVITKNTRGRMERDPTNATVIGDAAVKSKDTTYDDKEVIRRQGESLIPKAADLYHRNLLAGKDISLGEKKIDPTRLVNTILKMGGAPTHLPIWLKEAGMPEMTEEQYLNDPKAQRQLIEFKLPQFQEQTGSANGAANMWFTGNATPSSSVGVGHLQKFNSGLAQSATMKELGAVTDAHIDSIGGENETFPDVKIRYRQHVEDRQAQEETRNRRAIAENQVAIQDALIKGSPDTGKPYRDFNEFKADPANDALIARVMETDPKATEHLSARVLGYRKAFMVQTDIDHLNKLLTEMKDNPTKFTERDFFTDPLLGESDMKDLHRKQSAILRQGPNPNLHTVFNALQAKFGDEVPVKSKDEPGYNNYVGRLVPAVEAWEEVNKRRLKVGTPDGNKALNEIHQELMEQIPAVGLRALWGGKDSSYNREPEIPEWWAKEYRIEAPKATDAEVRYAFLEKQAVIWFSNLYGENAARSTAKLRPIIASAKPTADDRKALTTSEVSQEHPLVKAVHDVVNKSVSEARQKATEEAAALTRVPPARIPPTVPESEAPAGSIPQVTTPRAARIPGVQLGKPGPYTPSLPPTVPLTEAPAGAVPGRGLGER